MGSGIKWIAFGIFVLATTAQLISMLTSFMVTNPYSKYFHDGIFYRCGALQHLEVARQNVIAMFGSEQIHIFEHIPMSQQHLDSILSRKNEVNTWFRPMPSICYWWNHEVFMTDRKSLRATVLLAFISSGFIFTIFVLLMCSQFTRCKPNRLEVFIGSLSILNCLVVAGMIISYTVFINSHKSKSLPAAPVMFTIDLLPLYFSWSYWTLYGAAGAYLLAGVLYICIHFVDRNRGLYYNQVYAGYLK